MRKFFILTSVVIASIFILSNGHMSSSVSAQKNPGGIKSGILQNPSADSEMAAYLKRVTSRTSDGLTQRRSPGGAVDMFLDGRFQNVMLARVEDDGEMGTACIDNIDDANHFFGRDLETGRALPRSPSVRESIADIAKRHGMSENEYNFYVAMINEAARRQSFQRSPESSTININNLDGAGEGFNDPALPVVPGEGGNPGATRGAQRLNVFTHAAGVWAAFLDSNITTTIDATFDGLTCSSGSVVLGSAGANAISRDFPNAPFTGTWYHGALGNKIRNADPNLALSEIVAQFNSNLDNGCFSGSDRFYYGLDTNTAADTTNLLVVLLHEMGHGLGFSTFVSSTTGALNAGFPDIYTRFTFDREVGLYWNQMTDAQRLTSRVNDGDVFWDGANVIIASGNLTAGREPGTGRVQLHTPTTFSAGSSVSHFSVNVTPSVLMEPFITPALDTSLDLTRQQMRDIGWYRDTTGDQIADTITGVSLSGTAVIGSNRVISWTNNGGFTRNVSIELSTDGGVTFPTVVATNITNTGSFNWTVPNSPTTTGRLRVREHSFVAPLGASAANFAITSPTAASVSVSGRVTTSGGRSVGRAAVYLLDVDGNVRTVQTNFFGYYLFEDVPVGNYVMTVTHKQFQFGSQVINVNEDITNADFAAMP